MPGIGSRIRAALRTPPMRFQVRGVRFLEALNGRAIIGDEMGLGKTLETIAWMCLHPEARPAIIVCPATVKEVWLRQIREHTPHMDATVLEGRSTYHGTLRSGIAIINYDILQHWADRLISLGPRLLVIDECHRIANHKANRTRACISIGRIAKHVIALSGTPIVNRPIEFFSALNLIAPAAFPSRWKYAMQYCNPKIGYGGHWNFNGASHVEELHERVSKLMIRRTKDEVLKDLPPKTRTTIPVEVDNRADYEEAKADFLQWLEDRKGEDAANRAAGALALVRLGGLKRIAAEGKMKTAITWIREWTEDTDQKLVIFAIHRSVVEMLQEAFPGSPCVYGGVSGPKRTEAVDRFQNDPKCQLFIGNIKSAGEGITLHSAANELFLEIGWTPAEHDQAEDRIRRIGQTAKHINIYYMVAQNTIEEHVLDVIEAKRRLVNRVVDGYEGEQVATEVISYLKNPAKGITCRQRRQ